MPLSFSRSISIPALYCSHAASMENRNEYSRARCASALGAWRYYRRCDSGDQNNKAVIIYEAEINRVAGEIALKSPDQDAAKAEAYFERALAVARQQQAKKSWELRAAMGLAQFFWRDQGKAQRSSRTACSGLRLVYGGV